MDIRTAVTKLILSKPWYGTFASMIRWRESKDIPTAGVAVMADGYIDGIYNQDFIDKLTINQIIATIQHEVDHVVRMHVTRGYGRDKNVFNFAADAIVNGPTGHPHIEDLPKGCIYYREEWPKDLSTEELYDYLKKEMKCPFCGGKIEFDENGESNAQCGGGEGGEEGEGESGSGGGGEGEEGEDEGSGGGDGKDGKDGKDSNGKDGKGGKDKKCTCTNWKLVDNHDTWDKSTASEDQAKGIVKRHSDTASQAAGNTPGHLEEAIERLKEVTHNWKREFKEYLGRECGGKRPCLSRPNRRINKFGVPGTTCRSMVRVTIAVDTSGSISQEDLCEFFSHIDKISTRVKIKMIEFDHQVQQVRKYRRGDWKGIKVLGRGGTSFVNLMDHMEQNGLVGEVNIIFTDGYAEFPEEKPYQVMWAICSNSGVKPPWGKVITCA